MKRHSATTGRAGAAVPRGRALTRRSSLASGSSSKSSKSSGLVATKKKASPHTKATKGPVGSTRGLSRRASHFGSANSVNSNASSSSSAAGGGKKKHHSPPKANGAGFGAGAKNKSYRELVKSEEEALAEVERLKEKLRARHAHHQQDAARAKEARAQLEADIATATQQLAAEKENGSSLSEIVQTLRQKGTALLGQLEAHGFDGIAGQPLDQVELPETTGARLDQVEQQLAEARAAVDATMEMQREENDLYGSVMQDVRAMLEGSA